MEKKHYLTLVIGILVILVLSFFFFYQKEQIQASPVALVSSEWKAHFSSDIKLSSIRTGDVYVVNSEGKKIAATIRVQSNKKSISVKGIQPGNYTLYVEKGAFKKGGLLSKKHAIPFKIIETIETVQSNEELKNYFSAVLNKEQRAYRGSSIMNQLSDEKSEESSRNDSASGESSSHSTTNNQVGGVEEGDITVVNERYIFSIKDQSVFVTDAGNPRKLNQVAKLTPVEEGYVHKLLLHENLLLVVVEDYTASKQPKNKYDINMTKVFIYDIEKPTNPELVRIVGQEGSFTNIRKVGQTVYMVLNYSPSYWLLQESKSTELRPLAYDSIQGEDYEPIDYKDISILPGTLEGQYSIIKAIDLTSSDEKAVTTKGYLGGSSGLFMSESALYLTGHKYEETVEVSDTAIFSTRDIWVPQVGDTDIYKWSVSGVNIDFVGAATVEGTVLNQYSMDEYNGYFRIATTEGSTRDEKSPSKNHLFVLNESMQVVGQINDLARGEKIYSARFMGDKAYLVTFKEVDPLFVIDVAEPTKPKVLGELKIPGFSNYLHPLDERHLIGIGYDTKVMTTEYSKEPFIVTDSMKVSLFDVSDLNNPKEKDHVLIGGRGTYSEIQHDPKALFRHEKLGLYGFPVVLYDETKDQTEYLGDGALIYEITVANGITLKGDLVDKTNIQMQYEDWESTVQRIVYIGDTLLTVARGEMKSYVLESYELLDTMKIK